MRFAGENVDGVPIKELRGMEGLRIKALYADMGIKYGVTWKGRNYNPDNWDLADNINRAISMANAALYSLTSAVVCALGYLPELGFIHVNSMRAFVLDVADIYKPEVSLPAAFETVGLKADATEDEVITRLKFHIEDRHLLPRMPKDLEALLEDG